MTLSAGQLAPSFTLPSSDGGTLALDDLRGSIVVLYFYPRDSTPGCTIEAQDFTAALSELKSLGAVVLGASKDSVASHCKFRDKFSLTFPLLSDPDGAVLTAYGAWGEKLMYGKPVTGIIRSTVIIGRDGRILRHFAKVSAKGHAAQVIAAVRELASAPAITTASAPAPAPVKKPAPAPAAKTPVPAAAKKPAPAKKAAPAAKKPAPAKKPAGLR